MSCNSSCCRKNTFTYANICCENPAPEWRDFTPVIEGVTLSNNSSLTGRYIVINKNCVLYRFPLANRQCI